MSEYDAIIRETGLSRAIHTRTMLRQQEAIAVAIDPTGKVTPFAAPRQNPLDYTWGPSSTVEYRVPRAGRLVLFDIHATTAPSSGDATIVLIQRTETGGEETIVTLTVPEESEWANIIPNIEVPAGARLIPSVTDAQGMGGVSPSVVIET